MKCKKTASMILASAMLLGLLALVIGGAYTVLLGRDIVNLKL